MTTSPDKPKPIKVTEPSYTGSVFKYDKVIDPATNEVTPTVDIHYVHVTAYECMPSKCIGTMEYSTPTGGIYDCDVILTKYISTDQNRLVLIDSTYGEPVAEASKPCNFMRKISDVVLNTALNNDYVAIKDYDENEGILEQLLANNIISELDMVHIGGIHSRLYICKLVLPKQPVQQELPL